MSKAWAGGSTRAWRRTRDEYIGGPCQLRHEHCTGIATEVHHLDGKAVGDTRLIGTCHRCHTTETRKQTQAASSSRPRATRQPERHPGLI